MRMKWTEEAIIKYIEDNDYIFIKFVEYKKSNSRILIKCSNPNHNPYEVKFDNFKQGKRCPKCKSEKLSKIFRNDFKEVKKDIENFGYKIIEGEYVNVDSILTLICPNGHKWITSYRNFKHGNRCSNCYGNTKLTYDYVKKYIESFGYKLLSKEYKNSSSYLFIECSKGHKFYMTWNKFQQGERCPKCSKWKGESSIINILEKFNIEYEYQKTFNGLIGLGKRNNLLSYDFYLPKYNKLIEYQGEYHDGTARNQNKKQFKKQQEHDERKRKYAKDNNIDLLEIWYWDFKNIENILIKELNLK